jgi:hypothetical protein
MCHGISCKELAQDFFCLVPPVEARVKKGWETPPSSSKNFFVLESLVSMETNNGGYSPFRS